MISGFCGRSAHHEKLPFERLDVVKHGSVTETTQLGLSDELVEEALRIKI